ncbi:MAG: glycosyltransferase family 4 protein [Chitinophagaceae bacterium]|nr:glycosyltransferase family 4 protein [Chitinophagaceae bacterium]MCW5905679.1 glycosyltransferase family 4 protein [Chitinophagaceae bacterium]
MKKLAIVSTHPIQYYAPLFKLMAENNSMEIKIFYTWGQAKDTILDKDFGIERKWDIPLLEGYEYQFVENVSKQPGSHHYKGIINPTLISDIEDWNANAILIFGWNFQSHLKAIRYFKGKIPIIFRGDSTLLDEPSGFSIKKIARRVFLTWVYKHIDIALYVGKANKAYYKVHGLKEEQLIFAPHAIDNNRFATITQEQEYFIKKTKQHFQIVDTDITFVFCGKFQPKKNPLLLLNTFKQILQQNIHLIFVGNGELENEMKAIATNDARIHFLPFQNQSFMPTIYRLGDVYCLPSSGPGETWGLAVNEAMACRKAVLVSNKCGCSYDLIQEGINGFVFKTNDTKDLAEKIDLLAISKQQLQQMGKASESIIQIWNFKKIAEVIHKLIIA